MNRSVSERLPSYHGKAGAVDTSIGVQDQGCWCPGLPHNLRRVWTLEEGHYDRGACWSY
jgi:hypothetical protein